MMKRLPDPYGPTVAELWEIELEADRQEAELAVVQAEIELAYKPSRSNLADLWEALAGLADLADNPPVGWEVAA